MYGAAVDQNVSSQSCNEQGLFDMPDTRNSTRGVVWSAEEMSAQHVTRLHSTACLLSACMNAMVDHCGRYGRETAMKFREK